MMGVKGTIGLPSFNIASFQKDRAGRTKSDNIFHGATRTDPPRPKQMPKAPQINPQKLVKAVRLKETAMKPPLQQAPLKTIVGDTTPVLPKQEGLSSSPRPEGPPPLNPDQRQTISSLYDEVTTELSSKVQGYVVDTAMSEMEGKKGLGERKTTLIETRTALLKDIESKLAEIETGPAYLLKSPEIRELRTLLVQLAVDVSFPDLARTNLPEGLLTGPDGKPGETAQTFFAERDKATIGSEFRDSHALLVGALTDMRTGFVGTDTAKIVTGDFLKAMADTPLMRGTTLPGHVKMGILHELVQGLSKGDISSGSASVIDRENPKVGTLLSGLRSNHYAGDAARNFVVKLDPIAHQDVLARIPKSELGKLDAAAIRKMLPKELHGAFDEAVGKGRDAAKARDEFDLQRMRTARVIGPENSRLAEASVLLRIKGARAIEGKPSDKRSSEDTGTTSKGRTDTDGTSSDRAPSDVVGAALKRLAKTNKEGAFQVAKLSLTMEKLAKLEQEALGYNQFGIDTSEAFTSKAILDITGVTDKDIKAMGYSVDETYNVTSKDTDLKGAQSKDKQFKENMGNLGRVGFKDVDDVTSAMTRLRGGKAVLENRDVQSHLKADLQHQTTALGKVLQKEITADVLQTMSPILDPKTLESPDKALTVSFTGISTSIQDVLFKTSAGGESQLGRNLGTLQTDILKADVVLTKIGSDMVDLQKEVSRRQQILADYSGKHGKIDSNKPAGLDSAKLIIRALELDDAASRLSGPWAQVAAKGRDEILFELKGFDAEVLKRTWTGKSPFSSQLPPTIHQIRELSSQAEAIVFLRETAPQRLGDLQAEQNKIALARHGLMEERRSAAPQLFDAMNRMIHAAVLSKIPFDQAQTTVDGAFAPSFDMKGRRDTIVAQLQEWGMDTGHFAAEIDHAIARPITAETLSTWRKSDTRGSMSDLLGIGYVEKPTAFSRSKFLDLAEAGIMLLANKTSVDTQMRTELSGLIEALPNNSKFDLASGTELSINSGRIPVDPSGTITVRGRLAGSVFKSMVIETGSNGEIKVTGMLGGTVKAGLDIMAGYKILDEKIGNAKAEIKLGAELSGDLGYEGAGGYQIVFPKGEVGRQAAIDMIMKLTERQKPSAEIFETASDVSSFKRHKGNAGFKAELSGKLAFNWSPTEDGDVFGTDANDKNVKSGASNKHGIGIGAGIVATGGVGSKKEIMRGLDKATVKTEFQTSIGVSAKASVYAQTFSALGIGINQAMTKSGAQAGMDERFDKDPGSKVEGMWDGGSATTLYELAGISAETSVTSIHKKKFEFDAVGVNGREVMTKAELKEVTDGGTTTMHHIIATLSGGVHEVLQKDEKKMSQVRSMLDEISRHGLSSSMIEVTYNIRPEKLALANELFREADLAKASGDKKGARELMVAAQGIVDDRENYTPDKISLLDKTTAKGVANRGNAVLVKLDITSSVGTERVMMSVNLK